MSFNYGQIPPLTTELAVIERLKTRCLHVFSVAIDRILLKVRSYKGMIMMFCMSSNFGQMGPLTMEQAALERLKIDVSTFLGCY